MARFHRLPFAVLAFAMLIAMSHTLAEASDEPATSVGRGVGFLQSGDPELSGGVILIHSDESYENGYSWRSGGVVPPDYGAFSERFSGEAEISAAVFDLTQIGLQAGQTMDVYVWEHGDGEPGAVFCAVTGIDPGPVAFWPSISRHVIDLPDCPSEETPGEWWIGTWGNWPGAGAAWFVAADLDGPGGGSPFTNIAAGIGYPTGWQDVSVVWGPTQALGIGAIATVAPPPTTLQEMIDAADPGEVVLVPPGTYTGPGNRDLDFGGKDIVLRSEQGSGATIIDCGGLGRGFQFQSGETAVAAIEGFTIRNGVAAAASGGAIYIGPGASPTLRDVEAQSCEAGVSGGAFYVAGSTLSTWYDISVESCLAPSGSAIAIAGGELAIDGARLLDNEATDFGGAAVLAQEATVSLEGAAFRGSIEGALWVNGGVLSVLGGEIRGSSGLNGASAIRATSGAHVTIDFVVLTGNLGLQGGAVSVDETSSAEILRSTISSNRALGDGGGLWVHGSLTLERSIVWGNCAGGTGDQIRSLESAVVEGSCSAIDLPGVVGPTTFSEDVVSLDPMLCGPASCEAAPTVLGNYHLQENSPGLPIGSPCGELLGPLWIRCPVPQVPSGACCLSTSECFLTIPELCGPYGGFYAGDGSTCDPGSCEPASAPDPVAEGTPSLELRLSGPHPAGDRVQFSVAVAEGGRVRADLYDAAGRHVAQVFDGELERGVHELVWEWETSDRSAARNGVYYLRASLAQETVSTRVIIFR